MRALLVVAVVAASILGARSVSAQPPEYSTRTTPSLARQLILEREIARGRQRAARMEYKKWVGVSPQRPRDTTGFGMNNLYRYENPAWYPQPVPFWSWRGSRPYYR